MCKDIKDMDRVERIEMADELVSRIEGLGDLLTEIKESPGFKPETLGTVGAMLCDYAAELGRLIHGN
jgi:hypothetical protein